MQIANPIYDIVFKYLMDDNKLAKLLLSTILGEEIVELTFSPQEHITKVGYSTASVERQLTVYRLDFAAIIQSKSGEKRQVLIEIQKAKLATDIMRFRRYLGNQYRNKKNTTVVKVGKKSKKQALPLLTVYFLGHPLEHSQAPVIHVRRESWDMATGDKLVQKETFIESLTHDSYVIQISYLRPPRRTELEEMLQIFDQTKVSDDQHLLNIDESEVPERYRPLLRRLQLAISEPEIAETMDMEDDILEDLQNMERDIEQERAEKEKALVEKEKALEREQDALEREQEALVREKQKQVENEKLRALLEKAGIKP